MSEPTPEQPWEHPGGEQSLAETARLAASAYIALTTFRRDGTAVPTPVWVSTDGHHLDVWTERTSGKAKRIAHRGHVRVAPCDARGRPQGQSVEGSARVLDAPEQVARVEDQHRRKYGVQFHLWRTLGRLARRNTDYVVVEITVV